jgi:hypothetical protein
MSRSSKKSPRVRDLVDRQATRAIVGQINRAARTPEKSPAQTPNQKQHSK